MDALELRPGDMAALIGAGGKTTTMYCLAQELRRDGGKVLLTTTTKIFTPGKPHVDRLFLVEDIDTLADACAALAPPVIIGAGAAISAEGKLLGLPSSWLDRLYQDRIFDAILVEADGAASRLFKVPAESEPVVPRQTPLTVWIMAITVLNKPLDAEWVHRADRAAALLGDQSKGPLTPASVVKLVKHPEGCWKGVPPASRKVAIINQADSEREFAAAEILAKEILATDIERVLITSHKSEEPVKKVLLQ